MPIQACYVCNKQCHLLCECKRPLVNICEEHITAHLKEPGHHKVLDIEKNEYRLLEDQKFSLIEKLNYIKDECYRLNSIVVSETKHLFEKIETQSLLVQTELKNYMRICDEILQDIENLKNPECKLFFSPIESILIYSKHSEIIESLYPPVLKITDTLQIFSISKSIFPHTLYNFTNLTVGFKNNKLITYPPLKKIEHPAIFSNSRCLVVDHNKILITGGGTGDSEQISAYVLYLPQKSIKEINRMNFQRKWHAMSWIYGCPCVLGGTMGKESLKSVEIYKDDKWVQIEDMNFGRSSFSATCYRKFVWVVGGIFKDALNIEKFEDGVWRLLYVEPNLLCSSIGLCYLSNGILLLGGSSAGSNESKISLFNERSLQIRTLKELTTEDYFPFNCFYVQDKKLISFDHNCYLREYLLNDY